MKSCLTVLFGLACVAPLAPHDIITTKLTYTRDISRIFEHRCVTCHAGNSAIPLTTYEQVRPWAVGIKEQVLARTMPPWGAVKGFGHFEPDGGLSQEEIMIIAWWVTGGAPQGDKALLPKQLPEKASQPKVSGEERLAVESGAVLRKAMQLAGIRPLVKGAVESARITAKLPGARREPLLWLDHYDGRNDQIFRFRTPMKLPAGMVVESTVPLRLELEAIPPSPAP